MARPRNLSDEEIIALAEKYEKYIDETDIPIVAEFAYQNNINRQMLYDYDEFSTLTKKCIAKKEVQLERKSLSGEVNTTQAIFSLKQLGWRDRTDNKIIINTETLSDEEIDEILGEGSD